MGRPGSQWAQMASYCNTAMNLRVRHSVENVLTVEEICAPQGLCSINLVS